MVLVSSKSRSRVEERSLKKCISDFIANVRFSLFIKLTWKNHSYSLKLLNS